MYLEILPSSNNSQNLQKPYRIKLSENRSKNAQKKGTQVLYCQDETHAKPLISKNLFKTKKIVGTKSPFSSKTFPITPNKLYIKTEKWIAVN